MNDQARQPLFSVVLPTRNRPALFREALDSALSQSLQDIEVLVVNDGSDDQYLAEYKAMESQYDDRVRWFYQPQRPNGHGQSYSMNTGAYNARSHYVCFLDDDDTWTDTEHLQRAYRTITASPAQVDVLYSDQIAYNSSGDEVGRDLWIATLRDKLNPEMRINDEAYRVTPEFLLKARGFAHLNCTIIHRDLYLQLKGMDENIRYECDRDLFMRTIDNAENIIYLPFYIGRHNVPDPKKKDNMSTLVSDLEKRLYQITVLEKIMLLGNRDLIRNSARFGLWNAYKHTANSLASAGRVKLARRYARKALSLHYTFKWHLYCIYLGLRSLFVS